MDSGQFDGGFADPVHQAQTAFRAIMDALANPGSVQSLGTAPEAPQALGAGLAAIALTLFDHETPVWLAPALAGSETVVSWLRFHAGASLVADPAEAHFALVAEASGLPDLGRFSLGTDEYPDRSTTIVLAMSALTGGMPLTLKGPGIRDQITIAPMELPDEFVAQWEANREQFPRGIDLLLVNGGAVMGLPRSTRIGRGTQ